ncbi:tachykinin-like peptides receptor 99D isoform X2 [Ptychodera flava]|uniref:tachykinin-like peptides receptor 99D isoform X2 n=1 Tax=Ptychodera flava TaxID=63121 RepID=UPI003969DD33
METSLVPVVSFNFSMAEIDFGFVDNRTNSSPPDCSAMMYTQPAFAQFLWSLLFGVMIVIAAGGNIIVVWIVLAHRRMRTVTNYFLVNLAIADAMVATLNVPFNFSFLLNNIWYFGFVYCKIARCLGVLTVIASVFTLSAIAVDRYIAIVHPMRPRMSKSRAKTIIAFVWVIATIICLPLLIYARTKDLPCKDGKRTICILEWPDGTFSDYDFWYNVASMILAYFLPLSAMAVSYTIVGIKLWVSHAPGESSSRHREQLKAKRKVVKMMIVVVLLFAICWLPVHVYILLGRHHREIYRSEHIQEIYMFIYWLAMSNSMTNPFIYCWMNDRFRKGFKKALRFLPGVKWKPEDSIDAPRPSLVVESCRA